MKFLLLLPLLCLFCIASPQQPTQPPQPQQPVAPSFKQFSEDTIWVLDHFGKWIAKFDAAVDAGKKMSYTPVEANDLALLQFRSRRLAVDWQAVFSSFWDKHNETDTLAANPKYESALAMAQEMTAISGATQAAISEILKPTNTEAFALNVVDFVGIYRRMEQARAQAEPPQLALK